MDAVGQMCKLDQIARRSSTAATTGPEFRHLVLPAPPDLEIRVSVDQSGGEIALNYLLHSPAGRGGFHYHTISGPRIQRRPEEYQSALLQEIERLVAGARADGSLVLKEERIDDLAALGRGLYRELFSPEMRAAYRVFRDTVETILITSEEPWIPWELIKPYDDEESGKIIDDDFLCVRFQLTRWLSAGPVPAATIGVERMACIEAGEASAKPLPHAEKELRLLRNLARRHRIEDLSLPGATWPQVKALLEAGGLDLLHFVGHGRFDSAEFSRSHFELVDGRHFRSLDLHGGIQTRIKRRRPLVFLNACQVGRLSFSLTGLSGWASHWVVDCGCGVFVGPLWKVDDRSAYLFATSFYELLEEGKSFSQAALLARLSLRKLEPTNPNWLAFTIYAHPNGHLTWLQSAVQNLSASRRAGDPSRSSR